VLDAIEASFFDSRVYLAIAHDLRHRITVNKL
jgi:hypothetical protein